MGTGSFPGVKCGWSVLRADIYNAVETALFYKLMPNKTLELKGNKCFGGKSSKERITALLCTNSTGTDKLKPLIIGKFGKPRCLKEVQHLPCEYRHNTKAWMTSVVFKEWLLCLERRMKAEKRRILLIIDNCSCHNCVPCHLEHVKFYSCLQVLPQFCSRWIRG